MPSTRNIFSKISLLLILLSTVTLTLNLQAYNLRNSNHKAIAALSAKILKNAELIKLSAILPTSKETGYDYDFKLHGMPRDISINWKSKVL